MLLNQNTSTLSYFRFLKRKGQLEVTQNIETQPVGDGKVNEGANPSEGKDYERRVAAAAATRQKILSVPGKRYDAEAHSDAEQQQLKAKINDLQAVITLAQVKENQTGREKAEAVAALKAEESAAAAESVKFGEIRKQVAALTAAMAVAKREAAETAKRPTNERSAGNTVQASLAEAQANRDRIEREKAVAIAALRTAEVAQSALKAKLAASVDEQAKGTPQEAVASAQAKADQADREKTAAIAALRAIEAADAGQRKKLEETQKDVATLTAELAGAKRDTEQATKTAQRLIDERVDGRATRTALTSARAEADLAGHERIAALAALHAAESADAEHGKKLQEAQQRAAGLAAELESAKHQAALSKESAQRLADERVHSGKLQAALASARVEADRADREKAAAVAALQASESAEAEHQVKLEEARKRMAAVSNELALAKRVATQTEQKPDEPVNAKREKASSNQNAVVQTKRPSGGIMAHVMLHYSIASEAARTQAALVKSQLGDLGLDVVHSSEPQKHGSKTEITYYYKQDERAAISIADKLRAPDPVRTRISTNQPPRPGTIEVSLGDQTNLRSEASP